MKVYTSYRSSNPARKQSYDVHLWKMRARNKTNYLVKKYPELRPSTCSRCHKKDPNIQAHHYDYSKWYEVSWFCVNCHGLQSRRAAKPCTIHNLLEISHEIRRRTREATRERNQ